MVDFLKIELVVGFLIIILGLSSLIMIYLSKRNYNLSNLKNVNILRFRNYLEFILWSVMSLFMFSLWHTIRESFEFKEFFGATIEFPEYFFISFVYVLLFLLARKIYKDSKINSIKNK